MRGAGGFWDEGKGASRALLFRTLFTGGVKGGGFSRPSAGDH